MSVKWLIKDTKRALAEGRKKKRYFETTLDSILNHWNGQDLKFIRIENGKSSMDFILYNSEDFTRNSGIYDGIVIFDSFQLMMESNNIGSPAANEVLMESVSKKLNTTKKANIKYWFNKEQTLEIATEIEKVFSLLEEFKIMDTLSGDQPNNSLLFVS